MREMERRGYFSGATLFDGNEDLEAYSELERALYPTLLAMLNRKSPMRRQRAINILLEIGDSSVVGALESAIAKEEYSLEGRMVIDAKLAAFKQRISNP